MGLCVIEGNRGGGGRNGESFLRAIGSNGFSWWWSYYNPTFPTSGYVEFADLDFSNVLSFRYVSSSPVSVTDGTNTYESPVNGATGTATVNGATGVTVRIFADRTNTDSSGAPIRTFQVTQYTDIHGVVHNL